jgi:hypothetical protein
LKLASQNLTLFSSALVSGFRGFPFTSYRYLDDLVQLLGEDLELQDPFEDVLKTDVRPGFFSDKRAEALAWIFQASYADYQHRSMEECGLLILWIVETPWQLDMLYLVRRILKERTPDKHMCSVRDNEHNTLLHRAIQCLNWISSERPNFDTTATPEIFKEMRSIITDFVKGGSDLHALTLDGQTPMLTLLTNWQDTHELIHNNCTEYTLRKDPPAPLRIWLEQLRYSGIDLRRYGRKEKSLWQDPRVNRESHRAEFGKRDLVGEPEIKIYRLRLINFIYGPEPGDWIFWIETVMPNYFMQFWEMVDHPEKAMPGAWEEQCSAYDRDYYDDYSDEFDDD